MLKQQCLFRRALRDADRGPLPAAGRQQVDHNEWPLPVRWLREPTGALDRASGRDVLALFQERNRSLGITIVVVTHDALVAEHAQQVVELEDSRVVGDRIIVRPAQAERSEVGA